MPQYCAVPECKQSLSGHKFPTDAAMQLKWRVALRRKAEGGDLWKPNLDYDRVCRARFKAEDYVETPGSSCSKRKYRKLKPDAVPSVFKFKEKSPQVGLPSKRAQTMLRRNQSLPVSKTQSHRHSDTEVICNLTSIREEIVTFTDSDEDSQHDNGELQFVCVGVQVDGALPFQRCTQFSVKNFIDDSRVIHYYTGLQNYEHFHFLYNISNPSAAVKTVQKFRCVSAEDQLFLTLMKLRCNKDLEEISILYSISIGTVSNIFQVWIMLIYSRMKHWQIWPSRKTIDETMPKGFRALFPSTRVIIDATEIPIAKPSDVDLQSQTFSNYKNKNTVKVMVGITPRGAVSFISDRYPGSASDRQIIEDCDLYNQATSEFEKGDSILADRGIMVQDLFAPYDVSVITPTPLRGKSQLEPTEVERDRRISSKRIHVERIIGLAKTYKILKYGIPPRLLKLCLQIVYVIFLLVNVRNCIVSDDA